MCQNWGEWWIFLESGPSKLLRKHVFHISFTVLLLSPIPTTPIELTWRPFGWVHQSLLLSLPSAPTPFPLSPPGNPQCDKLINNTAVLMLGLALQDHTFLSQPPSRMCAIGLMVCFCVWMCWWMCVGVGGWLLVWVGGWAGNWVGHRAALAVWFTEPL